MLGGSEVFLGDTRGSSDPDSPRPGSHPCPDRDPNPRSSPVAQPESTEEGKEGTVNIMVPKPAVPREGGGGVDTDGGDRSRGESPPQKNGHRAIYFDRNIDPVPPRGGPYSDPSSFVDSRKGLKRGWPTIRPWAVAGPWPIIRGGYWSTVRGRNPCGALPRRTPRAATAAPWAPGEGTPIHPPPQKNKFAPS